VVSAHRVASQSFYFFEKLIANQLEGFRIEPFLKFILKKEKIITAKVY
jgi:hypothetical protein